MDRNSSNSELGHIRTASPESHGHDGIGPEYPNTRYRISRWLSDLPAGGETLPQTSTPPSGAEGRGARLQPTTNSPIRGGTYHPSDGPLVPGAESRGSAQSQTTLGSESDFVSTPPGSSSGGTEVGGRYPTHMQAGNNGFDATPVHSPAASVVGGISSPSPDSDSMTGETIVNTAPSDSSYLGSSTAVSIDTPPASTRSTRSIIPPGGRDFGAFNRRPAPRAVHRMIAPVPGDSDLQDVVNAAMRMLGSRDDFGRPRSSSSQTFVYFSSAGSPDQDDSMLQKRIGHILSEGRTILRFTAQNPGAV